jgi:hypothetical protein
MSVVYGPEAYTQTGPVVEGLKRSRIEDGETDLHATIEHNAHLESELHRLLQHVDTVERLAAEKIRALTSLLIAKEFYAAKFELGVNDGEDYGNLLRLSNDSCVFHVCRYSGLRFNRFHSLDVPVPESRDDGYRFFWRCSFKLEGENAEVAKAIQRKYAPTAPPLAPEELESGIFLAFDVYDDSEMNATRIGVQILLNSILQRNEVVEEYGAYALLQMRQMGGPKNETPNLTKDYDGSFPLYDQSKELTMRRLTWMASREE